MQIDKFLRELLLQAGGRLKKHYGRVKSIQYKAGSAINMVTNVDSDVEDFVKAQIRRKFPKDSILAEESPLENADAAQRWIIDPLDGTTNFAHGLSYFSVSIGVELEGQVVAGGVYDPIHQELFFARKGKGATLNGKKIRVSRIARLAEALLVTGFPYDIHENPDHSLPYFDDLIQHAQGIRRLGSAALDLCYVAAGRFEGFFEVYLNPWDTAAGCLILRESGGRVTDFQGNDYSIYEHQIASSNGLIHQEMLGVLHATKATLSRRKRRSG